MQLMRRSTHWLLIATLFGCDVFSGEQVPARPNDPEASGAGYPVQLVDAAGE